MAIANTFVGKAYKDGSAHIWGKLTDSDVDGTPLTQLDFAGGTIVYQVKDLATKVLTVAANTGLTVADVLSDTVDSNGHNFDLLIPASAFPNSGRAYEVLVTYSTATQTGFGDVNLTTAF